MCPSYFIIIAARLRCAGGAGEQGFSSRVDKLGMSIVQVQFSDVMVMAR